MSKLSEKLKAGKTALGTHVTLTDSSITEMMGDVGFDYIWIDTEHSAIGLEALEHHLLACRATGTSALVRIPSVNAIKAKPVLEMGPDGIVFPQVNSYELALEAVKACMYPPKGNRGFGPRRAMHFGANMTLADYLKTADRILKILQFEHIDALKDLDRILSIEDLDVILLGPCDLASSMGHINDWHHPEVEKVVDDLFLKAHKTGKKVGVSFGACDANEMMRYKKRNVDMISIAADTDYIVNGAKQTYKTMVSVF